MLTTGILAVLGAIVAALTAGLKIGAWWRGRSAKKETAQLETKVAKVEVERDVQQGRADVAVAQAEVATAHVERQQAGEATAQEVRNEARTTGSPDPNDALDAVDEWVRRRYETVYDGPAADRSDTADVRDRTPTAPERPSRKR